MYKYMKKQLVGEKVKYGRNWPVWNVALECYQTKDDENLMGWESIKSDTFWLDLAPQFSTCYDSH